MQQGYATHHELLSTQNSCLPQKCLRTQLDPEATQAILGENAQALLRPG